VEGSYGKEGDESMLLFTAVNTAGMTKPTLRFKKHMYGSHLGSLEAFVLNQDKGTSTSIKFQQPDESMHWMSHCLPFTASTSSLVYFRATRGNGHESDNALDDICIEDGACPGNI